MKAAHEALQLRIRRGELVNAKAAERATIEVAHRVRDQLLTATAQIAAEFGLDPALLIMVVGDFLRDALTDISKLSPKITRDTSARAIRPSGGPRGGRGSLKTSASTSCRRTRAGQNVLGLGVTAGIGKPFVAKSSR